MRYEKFEEGGNLVIRYDGPNLSLHAFGVIQLNVQEIIDKVLYYSLTRDHEIFPRDRRYRRGAFPSFHEPESVLRTEISRVNSGSLEEVVGFMIAAFADPDVRAVLQGFAGNVVYALSKSGLDKYIRNSKNIEERKEKYRGSSHFKDKYDVGPNTRAIIQAVVAELNGRSASIKFKRDGNGGVEIEIVIDGD